MPGNSQQQSVEVSVDFQKNGLRPRLLRYGGRTYPLKQVNMVHSITDGSVRVYFFSVSDSINFWKLGFNTETLRWWVEDSYQN